MRFCDQGQARVTGMSEMGASSPEVVQSGVALLYRVGGTAGWDLAGPALQVLYSTVEK